jgi:CHRD domain
MAEMVNFKADLKATSEVPPNDSKGSGSVTATYDTAGKKLSYKGSYSGLTGPATAAHFHGPAEPGVITPLCKFLFSLMRPQKARSRERRR